MMCSRSLQLVGWLALVQLVDHPGSLEDHREIFPGNGIRGMTK